MEFGYFIVLAVIFSAGIAFLTYLVVWNNKVSQRALGRLVVSNKTDYVVDYNFDPSTRTLTILGVKKRPKPKK